MTEKIEQKEAHSERNQRFIKVLKEQDGIITELTITGNTISNKRPPQILCKLHKQCIIKANEWRKKKWAEKEHLRKRQDES